MNELLIKNVEVVDVSFRETASKAALKYFLERFPCLSSGVSIDVLIVQLTVYQSYNVDKCVYETKRIDETWREIGQLKDESGNNLFLELSKVGPCLFSI
ncbi:hypothetical protein DPMN_001969 [Dreissena polymorpha]|uniref:Uncharacterized protein n=1 Tax=Dreissena polymorpha TaxID=45954 RepID=A0A9D4RTJ2_DREPO|nr:hypothetical protein DPMN_001969 [Dreissena polymorpha]